MADGGKSLASLEKKWILAELGDYGPKKRVKYGESEQTEERSNNGLGEDSDGSIP